MVTVSGTDLVVITLLVCVTFLKALGYDSVLDQAIAGIAASYGIGRVIRSIRKRG